MISVSMRVYNGPLIKAEQDSSYYLSGKVSNSAYYVFVSDRITSNAKWFVVYRTKELTFFKI